MTDLGLGSAEREAALAIASAILPDTSCIPGGDERSVEAALQFAHNISPGAATNLGRAFRILDAAALPSTGRRFSRLDADRQEALLQRWQDHAVWGRLLYVVGFLFKASHFDHPSVYEALACPFEKGGAPEPARWLAQILPGAKVDDSEPFECDVVVMGSGAGGAVVGKELAEQGYAVLFIEEGEHHRRDSFNGSALNAKKRFYRDHASIAAVGNCLIPTFMGRLVGGSTAINTATCFRTPDWVHDEWCAEADTDIFTPASFARHYERVERNLWVEPVKPELRGGPSRVVARGCDALGWHHAPIVRNAPDCDAQGVCDFGCPSGARRSMDISYLPSALNRGAILITGMRGHRVLVENGRAVGLEARSTAGNKTLQIRAQAVVLAGGAVPTPLFLLEQGICNGSDQVGRNLSLHPACSVSAMFDESVAGHTGIPQTIYSGQFLPDGILLNAAAAPVSVAALMVPFLGRRLMDAMENLDQLAALGVMIKDQTRGRVRRQSSGAPLLTYTLTKGEADLLQEGMVRTAEMFFAAGAREAYPMLGRRVVLKPSDGVEHLRELRIRPWDFVLTSFHPLGTCRMGHDPATSVIGFDHQTHEIPGLFIVDGSTLPGPPSVNPQLTVMAFADRAAEQIAARL